MSLSSQFHKDYNYDPAKKIWIRKNGGDFDYSDGEKTEAVLGEVLSKVEDRSVLSDELKPLQTNWPANYYFSATRANLLRPLAEKLIKGARVLELGCGLGAITRYLGETAAEVVAVEGSERRGGIASLRCENLDNVNVLIDEIKSLPESLGKFDVVTLIGVLEYSCKYGGPGAELEVLEKARSFLKADGFLVLAIENKLGLKYLGGVPEDHIPRQWLGVTNGYYDNGVKTWSRLELTKLLAEAGFEHVEQFVPVPDYKMPASIITPAGLECGGDELNLGAIMDGMRRMHENAPVFNIGEAWQSICKAGLLPDLADSLCFVAALRKDGSSPFMEGDLVDHYGNLSHLPKKFCKQVRIAKSDNGIRVKRTKLAPDVGSDDNKILQVVEDEPYFAGETLFSRIRKVAMRSDWTLEELFQAFEPWAQALKDNADESWRCDGKLLDFMPFNLVLENGELKDFDQEWISREKLLLPHLLYRGFYHTLVRMLPLRKSVRHDTATFSELFNAFMKWQQLPENCPVSLDYLRWQEEKLLRNIQGFAKFRSPRDFQIQYM